MVFSQGDVVEVDFSPALGHEPMNRRPAVVVSKDSFNEATSMTLICPITSTDNGFFLHVPIPPGHDVYGFVATEQMKAMDLEARPAVCIDHLNKAEISPIIDCVKTFFD